jgi:hypothetical protein
MLFDAAGPFRVGCTTTQKGQARKTWARSTWRLATGPTASPPRHTPQDEDILSQYEDGVYACT